MGQGIGHLTKYVLWRQSLKNLNLYGLPISVRDFSWLVSRTNAVNENAIGIISNITKDLNSICEFASHLKSIESNVM